ncbi:hypothetical protein ABIE00_002439 [Arthrobacter sp. OAP107]
MTRKFRWRVVVTNGHDRTEVWFGIAASKTEAETKALSGHPGWSVQESGSVVTPYG